MDLIYIYSELLLYEKINNKARFEKQISTRQNSRPPVCFIAWVPRELIRLPQIWSTEHKKNFLFLVSFFFDDIKMKGF